MRKRNLSGDSEVIRRIIVGERIPKSEELIELEEHHELLANILNHLIRKVEDLQRQVDEIRNHFIKTGSRKTTVRKKVRKTKKKTRKK